MVNRGPSRGCQRCRELHTKCDQTQPECQKCVRRGIACPGYRHLGAIVIKDVTTSVVRKHTLPALTSTAMSRLERRRKVPPSMPTRNIAESVCYFFDKYIISPEKGMLPSAAYLDHLIPLYLNADESSSLALSVSAMASRAFRLQFQPPSSLVTPSTEDIKAIRAVQQSLAEPKERLTDQTLLAILCLDFAEHLTIGSDEVVTLTQSHMNGAAALVHTRGPYSFQDDISRSLLAGTISSLLLIALWTQDRSIQRLLDLLPDVDLVKYDHTVGLHQLIVKVIVSESKILTDTQDTHDRPSKHSHPQLFAEMQNLYHRLMRWMRHVPTGEKRLLDLVSSAAVIREEMFENEARPMREIAYAFAQWYCTRMSLLRVLYALIDSGDSLTTSESSMLHGVRTEAQRVAEDLLLVLPAIHDGSASPMSDASDSPSSVQSPTENNSPPPPRRGRRKGAPQCRGDLKNILQWVYLDLVDQSSLVPGFGIEPATLQVLKDKYYAMSPSAEPTVRLYLNNAISDSWAQTCFTGDFPSF